jgi:hypothetical protein
MRNKELIYMLKEIQINKTKCEVYAMDENYQLIATYIMSADFWEGTNEYGEPRCNAEVGTYKDNIYVCIDYPDGKDLSKAYGWAYINIDERGHALHGGGSNLTYEDALSPRQSELLKTYGCFRMYNEDIYNLAIMAKESLDNQAGLVITVVE